MHSALALLGCFELGSWICSVDVHLTTVVGCTTLCEDANDTPIDPFWSLGSRAGVANHSTPPYLNQNIPDQTLPHSDKQWPAALFAAVWTAVFTWVIKTFFKDAKEMVLLNMQIRPQTITNNAVMPQSLVLLLFWPLNVKCHIVKHVDKQFLVSFYGERH